MATCRVLAVRVTCPQVQASGRTTSGSSADHSLGSAAGAGFARPPAMEGTLDLALAGRGRLACRRVSVSGTRFRRRGGGGIVPLFAAISWIRRERLTWTLVRHRAILGIRLTIGEHRAAE